MISVKEAEEIIKSNLLTLPLTEVKTEEAYNCVLQEKIFADRPQPPFDRVAMDGIALNLSSWQEGKKSFVIEGVQAAGQAPLKLTQPQHCIEVMTGAVLPVNTDCVIKVEDIDFFTEGKSRIAVLKEGVKPEFLQNIHRKGTDYSPGELLLKEGTLMLPPQIAVAVSTGKAAVKVVKKPEIALISTGDELVDTTADIEPHQIRMSNTYAMLSALRFQGYTGTGIFHLKDDRKLLLKKLDELLDRFDVLILSGGVSMGKFDFIPSVLKELGVKEQFHKVSQKPGKPLWFGVREKEGKAVFGLPGNPVSSTICFYRYVVPYLLNLSGIEPNHTIPVRLSEDINVKEGMTFFIPVSLDRAELAVSAVRSNGSGDFASLTGSDGFIEVEPVNRKKGSIVNFYNWRL